MSQSDTNGELKNNTQFSELYQELITFYITTVKPIITASERIDAKQRLNESAIVEVRSAFDHVMRAHSVIFGIVNPETIKNDTDLDASEYCKTNFDKAFAHLYRAAYDAYDVISIVYETRIRYILDSVSPDALYNVVKDAQETIINPWNEASEWMIQAKVGKDVESKKAERAQFIAYEEGTKRLKKVVDILESRLPSITAYADYMLQINKTLDEFSQEVICEVLNDCAEKIYIPLADAKEKIQDQNTTQQALNSLKKINRDLQALVPAFAKRKGEQSEQHRTDKNRHGLIIGLMVIAIIISLASIWFSVFYKAKKSLIQDPLVVFNNI